MAHESAYAFDDALAEQIRALIDKLCTDPEQTEAENAAQMEAQRQATTAVFHALDPRDAIEAILSGHCVMYHYLVHDGARDYSRCLDHARRPRLRSGIMAAERGFSRNLRLLWRKQNGTSAASASAAANAAAVSALAAGLAPLGAASPAAGARAASHGADVSAAAPAPRVRPAAAPASPPVAPGPVAPRAVASATASAVPAAGQSPAKTASMFPVSAQSAILAAAAAPRRKPRFVCERVHIPNNRRTPQIGAVWRLPNAPKPIWDMEPPRQPFREQLLAASTAGGMLPDVPPDPGSPDWVAQRMAGKARADKPEPPARGKRSNTRPARRAHAPKSTIF